MKRVAVVVGTRPDVIKLGPVVAALEQSARLEAHVIATGQHRELLEQAVRSVGLAAHRDLGVMEENQSLATLTARLIPALDEAVTATEADFVLIQGDTATMLCAALVAFYRRLPIGHVEAGLRTSDVRAPFPEEANRRMVTPLVSLHFAPTDGARRNLLAEGVDEEHIVVTGNTVVDALHAEARRQGQPEVGAALAARLDARLGTAWADHPTVLVTVHRRESLGPRLGEIFGAIAELAGRFADHRFVYPVHLNPNVRKAAHHELGGLANLALIDPLGYDEFLYLLQRCRLVVSDSGGIQEEAPVFGKPVVVLRETTERPEGIAAGVAVLAGLRRPAIVSTVAALLGDEVAYGRMARASSPYGDGRAAERIVGALEAWLDGA